MFDPSHAHKAKAERQMIGVASLLSVVAGASVAYAADLFPTHVEALETGAGILLLAGFALFGVALAAACCHS